MKLLIANLIKLQQDWQTLSQHHRLNRACDFIQTDVPVMIEVLTARKLYIEQLERRIAELEGGRK